ncbi:MAG TPA: PAS domain-containing protein, partial [Flavisolibacter sp.]|nr:PAS domain-containing protein [Flavisolibacter sp.]
MTNETISQRASHAVDFKLFEATPGKRVVFLPDSPRFTIIAASEDMCRFLLLPKEQFLGQSVFDAFPASPFDPEFTGHKNLRASLDYVVQHKLPHKMERQRYDVAIEGRSFNETYWQNNSTPVLNDEGEVSFIIHTAEDITEQVKTGEMKENIKGMEQAYNLLLHAPVSIAILRGEKNIVELANASALKLWNQKDDVIGKPLSEVYPEIDGQVIFGLLDNVRKTGKPYMDYEVPSVIYRTEKKEIGYFDVVYQPFYDDYTNKASGVFTLSHDVTELVLARHKIEEAKKEAEKQKRLYETINGSTPDLIYVFDLNYRFTYINKALLVMWGKTWEQSIGKRLLENGYEAWHAEMHEREIDEVVATKMPVR